MKSTDKLTIGVAVAAFAIMAYFIFDHVKTKREGNDEQPGKTG